MSFGYKSDKSELERISQTLNEGTRQDLERIYVFTPHPKLQLTPKEFADNVAWAIYTEWCLNTPEKEKHKSYTGDALEKFIEEETHYALERAKTSNYSSIRENVLKGLVKRAIEIFSDFRPEKREDNNIRCDLNAYID